MKKRIISLLLSATMLFSLLPTTAMAGGGIAYIERSWNGNEVAKADRNCTNYSVVSSNSKTWNAGWYVVNANTTISSAITVSGDVHLILYDNVTLTAQKGIVVNGKGNNSLTIYGQSGDSGKLITTGSSSAPYGAGIGGGGGYGDNYKSGTITIHGGTIQATGGNYTAGIGDVQGSGGGAVTIYGGTVKAIGHDLNGAGIGCDTVRIYGGTVNATGYAGGIRGNVTVNGGMVTAKSDGGTANNGIGGSALTVDGGTVTATGYHLGAGIGSSAVTVNAGKVTATGGEDGPGISGSTLTVNGGTVTATGKDLGAGIVSSVSVNGGKITADGGDYATFEGIPAGISGTVSFGENFVGGVLAGASAENAFYMSKEDYCAGHSANYVTMPVEMRKVAAIVETGEFYDSVQAAILAAQDGQTVKMLLDSRENLTIAQGKNITLDLNGKVLTDRSGGNVIAVNGTLTLIDSDPTAMHDDASLPAGGIITGGSVTAPGSIDTTGGGGVLANGSFTMTGGTITGNSAEYGGGVFVSNGASFTMTDGAITGNSADYGGGVYVGREASFTMTGGTITENCGGVYVYDNFEHNVIVGGTAKIFGNRDGSGSTNNLYLTEWSGIRIETDDYAPTEGMSVGVTTADEPDEETPVTFAEYVEPTDAKYFFADNEAYAVAFGYDEDISEGCLQLVVPQAEDYYPVRIGGTKISRFNKDDVLHDGGSVRFDPDTNTLTLNNTAIATDAESSVREAIKSELPAGKTLTVKLIGTNVIGRAPDEEYEEYTVNTGLFIGKGMTKAAEADGSLLLIGDKDSSLTIYASGNGISSGDTSFGEDGKDGKKFEGELKIYSNHNAIESPKSVFANGGKIFMESQNWGIRTKGDVTVSDGELTIRAENRGISASEAVTISGGKLDVTGGEDNYAIFAGGGFSITSTDCQIIARGSHPDYGAIYSGSAPSFAAGLTMLGSTDKNAAKKNITQEVHMEPTNEDSEYVAFIDGEPVQAVTFKLVRSHVTHDGIEFQPWVPADHEGALLPNVAGNWYLTGDITLENPDPHAKSGWDVPEGTTNLCLNGTMLSLVSRIRIPAGATLNLYDCGNEEHEGYIKDHRWIPDEVEGGTKKSVYGGCILALADQALLIETNGTLNMYGGTVTGYRHNGVLYFTSVVTGPSVYTKGGRFNMYGGTITGNCSFNAYGVDNVKYQGIVRLETLTGVTIGKDAVIDENYVSKLDSATSSYVYEEVNLAVPADQLFTLGTGANAPTAKMHVGISSVTAPVLGAPVVFTGANAGENDASRFESNMEGIHIERRKNNALYLCVTGEPDYVPCTCIDHKEKQNGQAATCTEDGWNDYYKCTTCETLYSDEAMTNEITDLAAWKVGAGKLGKTGHDWTYAASNGVITATCRKDNTHTTALTLTAASPNYSGSSSTPVTYERSGKDALSSANLGTATDWTYNEKTYKVYSEFIPFTSGSSWNDAMGFVAALNNAKYDGHEDWTLLSSEEMASGWYSRYSSASYDSVEILWSSVESSDVSAYTLACWYYGQWGYNNKSTAEQHYGFVVLCSASGSTGAKIVNVGTDAERTAWKAALGDDSIPTVHYVGKTGSSTTLADTTTEPTTKGHYTAKIYPVGKDEDAAYTAAIDFDIVDKHEHSFIYSVNDAKLIATCDKSGDLIEGCDLDQNKVELTLTASSANYSGSAVEASYDSTSKTAWEAAGLTAPTITYEAKAGSSLTDGKAVNAGNYTASITVGTGADAKTATKDFAISKATPTIADADKPAAGTITYGAALSTSTLTGGTAKHGETTVAGTFAWTNGATIPTVGNSGYEVTFTPTDTANYNSATCTVVPAVNKANYGDDVSKAASADLKARNGSTVTIDLPELPDGASYGAVTNNNTGYFTVGTIAEGKVTVTSAKNWVEATDGTAARTFTVTVVADGDHNNYDITVSITPVYKTVVTISGVSMNKTSYTYGDTVGYAGTPSAKKSDETSATISGWTYTYYQNTGTAESPSWTKLEADPANAGSYKLVVETVDPNYEGKQEIGFTIAKKTVELIWTEDNFTYDGTDQQSKITVKFVDNAGQDVFLGFGLKVINADGGAVVTFKNVTPYGYEATVNQNPDTNNALGANYQLPEEISHTYHMKPKALTAEVTATKVYDGTTAASATQVTATVATGITGETLTISGVTGTFNSANVADCTTVTPDGTGMSVTAGQNTNKANYEVSLPQSGTGTITVFDLSGATVTLNKTEVSYTGNPITSDITVTVKDSNNNVIPATDYKVTYTNNINVAASTDANAPTVTVAPADSNTNVTGSKSVKFTINKVDKPGTTPTTYDVNAVTNSTLSLETIGITLQGAKISKIEAVSGKTGMVLSAAPSIINDGAAIQWTTVAQPSGTVDDQYTLTVSSDNWKDFTVTVSFKGKIPVTVSATGEDFVYGDKNKTGYTGLSVTDNLVDTATLEFLYESTGTTAAYSSANVPTDVGTYKVTVSVPESNTTYMGSKTVEFAITQQEVAVPSENETVFTYDGEEKTYMTVAADALYKLANDSAATSRTDAGETTIKLTLKDAHNYKWADNAADPSYTFTIAKKTITITPNAGQKKTYGENDPAFSYQNTALCGEDTLSGALSRAVGEIYDASGYAFALGTLAVDPAANAGNYTLTLAEDAPVFMIEKKVITVSDIIVADKVYDGKTDGVVITGYTLNGKKTEDTLTLTGILCTYTNAAVNAAQTVTLNDSSKWALDGTAKDNYVLATEGQPTTAIGKITKARQEPPTAPSVSGETVTIAAADIEKKLEYSLDGDGAWISVPTLDGNGAFNLSGLTIGSHTIYLRVKESGNYNASDSVSTSFTLTQYSVAYNANGGVGSIASQTANSGSSVTVKSGSGFSRTGYTFTGWNTKADGSGTVYAAGASINSGATLYARWAPNTYTVRFNANGGSGTMANQSFTYDADAKALTTNAFTRTSYTFVGWATSANGPVLYSDEQSVMNLAGSGTVTLYAVWAQNVYSINVNITSPQEGEVDVKLRQGNAVYAVQNKVGMSENGDKYTGSYEFTGVPAGTYNIEAMQKINGDKNVTMTQLVVLNANSTANIDLPESGVNSKLKVEKDTLPTVVGGLDKEAESNRQTGKDITVTMTVEKKEEQSLAATASAEDKATQDAISEIKATANGKALDFMNIEIEKTTTIIGGSAEPTKEAITETSSVLELVFSYEMNGKKNIQIYRQHGDEVQTFEKLDTKPTTGYRDATFYVDTASSLIYVYAKQFSTYAIGYEEQSSGGNTGGGVSSYAIESESAKNGTFSTDKKSASAGSTVTITVTPDKGFTLETLTVLDKNGKEVEVKNLGNNKYSFKMPTGKVSISATFMEDNSMLNFFVDVKATDYYYDAVLWAAENDITKGTDAVHFSPNAPVTRAQVVTFLWRAAGKPVVNYAMSFVDVSGDAYYTEAVRWAVAEGITKGTSDTTFSPDKVCTRGQIVTFLARFAGVEDDASGYSHGFTDVKATDYYNNAVAWAKDNKVTEGTSATTFSPNTDCTRGQVVTFLYRWMVK